jgi:hypothetical protein
MTFEINRQRLNDLFQNIEGGNKKFRILVYETLSTAFDSGMLY